MFVRRILIGFAALCTACPTLAEVRVVAPGSDPQELQLVVDSASPGDSVLVPPGVYPSLELRSGVAVIAETGPTDTILKNDRDWVVRADSVDAQGMLEGFTLDGQRTAEGVLLLENSSPLVRDCVIRGGWSGVRSLYSTATIRDCRVVECQNGMYLFESDGVIEGNTITLCLNGVSLVSSSPFLHRNEIFENTLGISVSKHSAPEIGGSVENANRIYSNLGGLIQNSAMTKRFSIRTTKPMTLDVSYNYWGSECPDEVAFRGPVSFTPWIDDSGTLPLEQCPSEEYE